MMTDALETSVTVTGGDRDWAVTIVDEGVEIVEQFDSEKHARSRASGQRVRQQNKASALEKTARTDSLR